jgi:hypothetical protein
VRDGGLDLSVGRAFVLAGLCSVRRKQMVHMFRYTVFRETSQIPRGLIEGSAMKKSPAKSLCAEGQNRTGDTWFFRSCSQQFANSRQNTLATTHGYDA